MRSILLTLVGFWTLPFAATAQSEVEGAKYELIRETIHFLAKDKTVSTDSTFIITCESGDYNCFNSQLSNNPITGITRWYNSWRSKSVTDQSGLLALRNQIFADIIDRPGKGYRKQLPAFAAYVKRMDELVSPNQAAASGSETSAIATDTVAIGSQNNNITTIYPDHNVIDNNENPKKENSMIAYIALFLGIIATGIIAQLLITYKNQQQQSNNKLQMLSTQLKEASEQIERLEKRSSTDNQVKEAVVHLTEIMESIETRVVELEKDNR